MWPANGLGMVLAEKGTLDHAKDVFARVREVSAEVLGDVWINLAHVYLAQNKHNEVTFVTFFGSSEACLVCLPRIIGVSEVTRYDANLGTDRSQQACDVLTRTLT